VLSYQHGYHAGSPADVHKHVLLGILADRLVQKSKPFCLLDVFAGDGVYDLTAAAAAKTGEYRRGIGAIWGKSGNIPAPVASLLARVRALDGGGDLVRYPGSPQVLKSYMRDGDRLILNELHPAAVVAVRRWAHGDARIALHARDGLEALTALVPPKIRRGLAVVDPSYEQVGDYAATGVAVARAARKWAEGIFAIWYPLLADERHLPLLAAIDHDLDLPTLISELLFDLPGLADSPARGIRGSGVVIVNPPWQTDRVISEAGEWLAKEMELGPRAHHRLRWVHPAK
jgi:23S rRNA (adenine2030-N6)-methyltransferase